MRVVYVNHIAQLSGAEISTVRLLAALGPKGVDRHVILGEDGPLVAELEATGSSVEVVAAKARLRQMSREAFARGAGIAAAPTTALYIRRLRQRLKELKPDLVHTTSLKAGIYGSLAGRSAGLPVVWQVQDRIASDYLPKMAVIPLRLALRFVPSAVVANSRSTLETTGLENHLGIRSHIVGNPYQPAEQQLDRNTVTESDATGDGRPIRLGMIGRIAPWKGQHVFVQAVRSIHQLGMDVEARIIGSAMFGEDAYESEIRSLVGDAGLERKILFLGFREDIEQQLADVDIVVHASITPEPFGQVVVEAMAAGRPIIASAAGGPSEIIDDGVTGILVTPNDPKALSRVLRDLIEDPVRRRRIGTAARESAQRFSPDLIADRWLAIYEGVRANGP